MSLSRSVSTGGCLRGWPGPSISCAVVRVGATEEITKEVVLSVPRPMPAWKRSTKCESGDCVEVARVGDETLVRNSQDEHGAVLVFSRQAWMIFLDQLKKIDTLG